MFTDGDRKLAELTVKTYGVFTFADAARAGLGHGQIDRRSAGVWQRIHQGVYAMPGVEIGWRGRLHAATLAAGEDSAVSHRAAAALHGLPGGRADLIEITCPRWERSKRPGLVVHEQRRLPPQDIGEFEGLTVVTPELLVLQLAWLRPRPDYIEAVIHAARRKRLITYETTLATFTRHARRGLRGVRAMRVALQRWDPSARPTESEMETMLLHVLRSHGLPEPVLQFEVYDQRGSFVARADSALPRWRVTVDYDSMQEHSDEFQIARDNRRRNRILAAGYFPLVARYGDLRSGGAELVDEIRSIARRLA